MSKKTEFLEHLDIPFDTLPNTKDYINLTELFDKLYGYKFSIKRKDKRKKEIVLKVTLGKDTYDIPDIETYRSLFQEQFSFAQIETKEALEDLCWRYVHLKMKWMNADNKNLILTMFPGIEEFYFLFRALQKTPYKKDPFATFDLSDISFHTINEYLFHLVSGAQQEKIELEEKRVDELKNQRDLYERELKEQQMREKLLQVEPVYFEAKKEIEELKEQEAYNQSRIDDLREEEIEYVTSKEIAERSLYDLLQRNFLIRLLKYRARKRWEEMIARATLEIERVKEEIKTLRIENKELRKQLDQKIREIEREIEVCKYHEFEENLSHYKAIDPKDVTPQLEEINQMLASSKLSQLLNDLKVLYEKNKQYLNLEPEVNAKEVGYQYQLKENV